MVQVYVARVDEKVQEKEYDVLYEKASDYRKQKADRLKRQADKLRSLAAGVLLDYGLRQYFNLPEEGKPEEESRGKEPVSNQRKAELRRIQEEGSSVSFGPAGKPYIEGVSFNLSHAGIYVAAAIGKEAVGIDVEGGRAPSERIAARCHPQEVHWYESGNQDKFYRLWTAKESVMKRDGRGIAMGLDSFSIFSEELKDEIYSLALDEDYWLSLCTVEAWNEKIHWIEMNELLEEK